MGDNSITRADVKEILEEFSATIESQMDSKFQINELRFSGVLNSITSQLEKNAIDTNHKFEIIDNKLDAIEKQTTKTNGRLIKVEEKVDILERKELTHLNNCPHSKKISEIESQIISKKAIISFILKAFGLIGVIVSIVYTLFKLLNGI